jgi:predicted ATP-dependent protease
MRPTIAVTKSEVGNINELALIITFTENIVIGIFIIV